MKTRTQLILIILFCAACIVGPAWASDTGTQGDDDYFWNYYLNPSSNFDPAHGAYDVYLLASTLNSSGGAAFPMGGSGDAIPGGNPGSGTNPGPDDGINPDDIFGGGGTEPEPEEEPIVNPEPASIFLIGSGMLGLGIFGRRFRKDNTDQ